VMALPWALEPSAFRLPGGQVRPEALLADEPEPEEEPGAAVPAGSEPQATRLREAIAARAANVVFRARREVIMQILQTG